MRVTTSLPETTPRRREEQATAPAAMQEWRTIVWDDPVNLMSYVAYVFRSYFDYPQPTAYRLMMQVHNDGQAVVSRGPREKMEVDVHAMHGYGLMATLAPAKEA